MELYQNRFITKILYEYVYMFGNIDLVIIMNYITRSEYGIIVGSNKCDEILNDSLLNYINKLCIKNMSSFEGRKHASKQLLKSSSNLPILVNDELFIFPTESVRNGSCFYINYFSILCIKTNYDGKTKIIFIDLSEIIVDISRFRILKQMKRVELLLSHII